MTRSDWPFLGGEMARRIGDADWSDTPLGPLDAWPETLRRAIEFVLPSPVPMLVSWARPAATFYNDAFIPIAGARHPFILGRSVQQHWPEVAAQALSVVSRIEAGESVILKGPILDVVRDGEPRRETFDVAYWPLRGHDGSFCGLMAAVTQAAALEDHAAALLRQTRFREFADASPDVLWILDARTLALEYAGPAFQALFGLTPAQAMDADGANRWLDIVVPEDREKVTAAYNRTRAGERVRHEYRIRRPSDGEERWIGATDFPLFDSPGAADHIGGIASDITEAKRAAERNDVLVAELQHRSRNLLAVISAVASRTLRLGGDYAAFESRLAALGRAQDLLSRRSAPEIDIDELVRAELAAHMDPSLGRITLDGPPAQLRFEQTQTLALVLHELATNAVKYGALSQSGASLEVTWSVTEAPVRRLTLTWRERDVRVAGAARRGFGRDLIERVTGGRGEYSLSPDGVVCRLELSL